MKQILTKNKIVWSFSIVAIMFLAGLLPIQPAAAGLMAVQGEPVPVDGRILTMDKTGDISDWIEIAQNGEYSLIMRKNFINIYSVKKSGTKVLYNDPAWQYYPYGTGADYSKSYVLEKMNAWFNGTALGEADNLALKRQTA